MDSHRTCVFHLHFTVCTCYLQLWDHLTLFQVWFCSFVASVYYGLFFGFCRVWINVCSFYLEIGYIHQLIMFLSCSDLSTRRTCSCLIYGSSKYFFFNEKSIGELNEFMNISIIKCMLVFLSTDSLNFLIRIFFFFAYCASLFRLQTSLKITS